jgi:hypothetical protein
MLIHARPMARHLKHMTPDCRHGGVELVCHGSITLTTSEVEIECPNASKYALGMHRLLRWFVGTVASLLGLSLLLVRWGFWASESTVVEDAQGMRAVLVAIQTEPAVLVMELLFSSSMSAQPMPWPLASGVTNRSSR